MSVSVEKVQVFISSENRLMRKALPRIASNLGNDRRVVGAAGLASDLIQQVYSGRDTLLADSTAAATIPSAARFRSTPKYSWQ